MPSREQARVIEKRTTGEASSLTDERVHAHSLLKEKIGVYGRVVKNYTDRYEGGGFRGPDALRVIVAKL